MRPDRPGFQNTDLTAADFRYTNLGGADLSTATNLSELGGSVIDKETKLPEGYERPPYGFYPP